jgi:hypothetical protein
LLIGSHSGSAFDATESVDCRADGEFAYTLDASRSTLFSFSTGSSALNGDSGEPNADSPNITSEDITAVEGLACANGIV